jgi:hypothetical protein
MTCADEHDSADVLIAFSRQWKAAAERMAVGKHLDDYVIGDPAQAEKLAPLLATRADLLFDFGKRIKNGELAG